MKPALATLAAACALLVSAAAASGSGPHSMGLLGVTPHSEAGIPSFALHPTTTPGTSGPLVYEGGRVMHTNTAYTIFWDPSGATACGGVPCTYDTNYQADINQYLQDVAAASGSTSNVYSIATQYYDTGYGGSGPIAYQSAYGGTWLDTTDQFPAPSNCDDGSDAVCLDDNDFMNEVAAALAANPTWQAGQSSIFFVLTPDGVGSCFYAGNTSVFDQACTTTVYCAYHSGYGTESSPTIYAVEPYQADIYGCNAGESPNADGADATINTLSHEQNEAITDYAGDAWIANDGGGSPQDEIGDLCAWQFGTVLGGLAGAEYNQVINGHDYWLQEEYSNDGGDCFQSSGALPPADLALPTISGTAAVSKTLASTAGSWWGSPSGYAYQWQRCSSSGTGCGNIPGATAASYTLQSADGGDTVRSTVSALNGNGFSSYSASAVSDVVVPLPAASVAPAVTGVASPGRTLQTTTGMWNTPMAFSYQWLRCDSGGAGCASIAGATASTYLVASADGGHTLEALISATNLAGTETASSNHTGVVVAKPAATRAPHISGRAKSGRVLAANAGAWSGSPTAFTYQWLRCNAKGASCRAIGHATRRSYRATKHDVGHRLRVRVAAHNRAGGAQALSAATAKILR